MKETSTIQLENYLIFPIDFENAAFMVGIDEDALVDLAASFHVGYRWAWIIDKNKTVGVMISGHMTGYGGGLKISTHRELNLNPAKLPRSSP